MENVLRKARKMVRRKKALLYEERLEEVDHSKPR